MYRLTTLRIVPLDLTHVSSYVTRKRTRCSSAQSQHSEKGSTALVCPGTPANFPKLFQSYPRVQQLILDIDSRQSEFRIGRISTLLESMVEAQGGIVHTLHTLKASFRSSCGCEKTVKALMRNLSRLAASGTFPNLENLSLCLDTFIPPSTLSGLTTMTSLRSLTFNRAVPHVFDILGCLTQLTHLDVGCLVLHHREPGETLLVNSFASLSRLTGLCSFSMEGNEVSRLDENEQLALCQNGLAHMSCLTRLVLSAVKVRSECWMNLSLGLLQRLQVLTLPGPLLPGLGSFEYLGPPPPGSPDAAAGLHASGLTLGGLTALTTTYIEHFCGRNTEQGVQQFVFTPALKSLTCSMFELEDSFRLTAQLGGTHLETLNIALPSLRMPMSHITQLTPLSGIREFSLSDTQIGGGGVPDLRVNYVSTLVSAWTGLKRLELIGKADMVGAGMPSQRQAPPLSLTAARRHLACLRHLPLLDHLGIRMPRLPLEVLPSCLKSLELCGLASLPPWYKPPGTSPSKRSHAGRQGSTSSGPNADCKDSPLHKARRLGGWQTGPSTPGQCLSYQSAQDAGSLPAMCKRVTRAAAAAAASSVNEVQDTSGVMGSPVHWRLVKRASVAAGDGGSSQQGPWDSGIKDNDIERPPLTEASTLLLQQQQTSKAGCPQPKPVATSTGDLDSDEPQDSDDDNEDGDASYTPPTAMRAASSTAFRTKSANTRSVRYRLPQLHRLRVCMPEWSMAKTSAELKASFQALVPLVKDACEELDLSRWALIKDHSSALELDDYVAIVSEHVPHLRRLQLIHVSNWWDKIDCSQLKPLSKLKALSDLSLQEPGRRWGVRVRNLSSLSCLTSLSVLVTGIECAPGGASRLVLHGMSEEERCKVLKWAQEVQDTQAGACLW
ncbi:hypothetical protein CEUSTIGMA_g3987.t1 [Chlamydomonas eustigma]|uniref:F-box domain-containing protein n=1 Tax=Chlamydomonas eustigma TaxID=1157962 RepID=A0A250X0E4_9CHLO|nr:hypothetical protein CEUSTIGMA_g3987.t1 [Chlamydomonas eustigma]|eukprot:GAX76541.1 hypothetical protein CEUSTIGMA_g3987.t1 [Chlamydomonas eustigma]